MIGYIVNTFKQKNGKDIRVAQVRAKQYLGLHAKVKSCNVSVGIQDCNGKTHVAITVRNAGKVYVLYFNENNCGEVVPNNIEAMIIPSSR